MITGKYLILRCAYDDRVNASRGRIGCTINQLFLAKRVWMEISKIDWAKSESLTELFMPFMYFGVEKPIW